METMKPETRRLWDQQNRHPGDRRGLFEAVSSLSPRRVLYPGSYVDVAASVVFDDVVYVDSDDRARRFFEDAPGVRELVLGERGDGVAPKVAFVHGDYRQPIGLADEAFDLLVSLYAGLVSDHCTRYLKIGGHLLVGPSHGDVALASLDSRYQLGAVVIGKNGSYRASTAQLGEYLIPKSSVELTPDLIRQRGRGVGYTRSASAYLFERIS